MNKVLCKITEALWRFYLESEKAGAHARHALRHAEVGALAQRRQPAPEQPLRRRLRALLHPQRTRPHSTATTTTAELGQSQRTAK